MLHNVQLHMIILMQNDLSKAVKFYQQFGFELKFHVPEKWAEFVVSGIKLGLAPTPHELPVHRPGVVFQVENLAQAYTTLKDAGVEFMSEPVTAIHGIMVSFKDPGNNVLDLYQPTPERLQELAKEQGGCCSKDNCC